MEALSNSNKELENDLAQTRKFILNREDFALELKEFSKLNLWKTWASIAVQWLWIGISLYLAVRLDHWLMYVLAFVVITSRQHALGVIMHEAVHYSLHPNRKINDIISNLFCGFPLAMSTNLYRSYHLNHHRYLNTDRDPQIISNNGYETWTWPKSKSETLKVFIKDFTGINTAEFLPIFIPWMVLPNIFSKKKSIGEIIGYFVFLVIAGLLISQSSSWYILLALWILPLGTLMNVIFRVRGLAEHICIPDKDELNATRTVIPTRFEKFFLAPLNVNYHLEHHLFPQVPFHRLEDLHNYLMKIPDFRNKAHITKTYLSPTEGLLSELLERKPSLK